MAGKILNRHFDQLSAMAFDQKHLKENRREENSGKLSFILDLLFAAPN